MCKLLNHVFVPRLKLSYFEQTLSSTPVKFRGATHFKLWRLSNLVRAMRQWDVKIIRGLTAPVASLVKQFLTEGGEWEKTEPDWKSLVF